MDFLSFFLTPHISLAFTWSVCNKENRSAASCVFVKSHAAISTTVQGTVCPQSMSLSRPFVCSTCRQRGFLLSLVSGSTKGEASFHRACTNNKRTGCHQTHATPAGNSLHVSSGNSRWTYKHTALPSGGSDRSRSHNRQRKSLAPRGNRVKIRHWEGMLQKLLIEHDGSDLCW